MHSDAQAAEETYNITLDANGGEWMSFGMDATMSTYTTKTLKKLKGESLILDVESPIRFFYNFLGWGTSPDDKTVNYTIGDAYIKDESTRLYAIWRGMKCDISYDANGGENVPDKQVGYYGDTVTLSKQEPTRTRYVFQGWDTDPSGTTVVYKPGDLYECVLTEISETQITGDITLYAVWKYTSYTVKYDVNGGSGLLFNQTKYHGETLKLSDIIPTKSNHTFLGWGTSSSDISVDYNPGDSYTSNSSITLYAIWKPKEYIVFFDDNEGSGAPSSQIKYHGQTLLISSIEPTKTGYDFVGWGENAEDSEPVYQPGDEYTDNSNKILYALWKIKEYKITYNANGGSGAPSSQSKYYGETITLRTKKPTRTNHVFQGWALVANATKAVYEAGDTYKNNKSVILYAVWKKKQTIMASDKSVVYGSSPFSLNAKASGGGMLTYTSSNKKAATVSTTGKITVKGYGKTIITIKAAATGKYLAATKKITVTVKPKKMTLKSVSSPGKKKLNISWTKDTTVTKYEVQFSTKKNFSSNTYKRTFAVSKSSTKLTSVPGKKTYYVRIRAYKTVNGTKYYGAWSNVKSVKVK